MESKFIFAALWMFLTVLPVVSSSCGANAFWCSSSPASEQPLIPGCSCCCYWGYTPLSDQGCSCSIATPISSPVKTPTTTPSIQPMISSANPTKNSAVTPYFSAAPVVQKSDPPSVSSKYVSISSSVSVFIPPSICKPENCPAGLGTCVNNLCVYADGYEGLKTYPHAYATQYCSLQPTGCLGVTYINTPYTTATNIATSLGLKLCSESTNKNEKCVGIFASSAVMYGNSQEAVDPSTGGYVKNWGMGLTEASGVCHRLVGPTGNEVIVAQTDRCGGYCTCTGLISKQECGPCVNKADLTPGCPCVGPSNPLYDQCCGLQTYGCPAPVDAQCDWCANQNHPHFDLDVDTFNYVCGAGNSAGSCELSVTQPFQCMDPLPWPPGTGGGGGGTGATCGANSFSCASSPAPEQPLLEGCSCCCFWGYKQLSDGTCGCTLDGTNNGATSVSPVSAPTNSPGATSVPTSHPFLRPSVIPTSKPSSVPSSSRSPISSHITANRIAAPYVDVTAWPPYDMVGCATATGQLFFTLAFIVSNNKAPSWGGYYSLANKWFLDRVTQLRAIGGDVIISFGGAAGQELAQTITTVSDLVLAYQSVIDAYGIQIVDFDIEGSAVADVTSIDRRNKAIRQLQLNNPSLRVHYTLPVMPTGLDHYGVSLINNAFANGVDLDVCNIMAMDYGSTITNMGESAISAAIATKQQLVTAGYSGTKLGITPMIGVNDIVTEIFQLSDASSVVEFAKSVGYVSLLSFWSSNRDMPGSSGISQSLYAFTNIFSSYTGSSTDAPSSTSTSTPSSTPVSVPGTTTTPSRTPTKLPTSNPVTAPATVIPTKQPSSAVPSKAPTVGSPASKKPSLRPVTTAPVGSSSTTTCGAKSFWCSSSPAPQQPMVSGCSCCCNWGLSPKTDGSCACQ